MEYRIIWLNKAVDELKDIRHYIETEEQAPEAAISLVTKIYVAANSLTTMPQRFQRDPDRPKYRRLVVISTYSIFYQIKKNVVYIAHIWNTARDIKSMD